MQDCLVSRILHHDGIKPSPDVREMCQLVAASAYLGTLCSQELVPNEPALTERPLQAAPTQ